MIYPYKCDGCGHYVEEYKPVSELNNPPICCGTSMRRLYTSFGISMDPSRRKAPAGALEVGNDFDAWRSAAPKANLELTNDERQQIFAESPELASLPD